MALRGGLGDVRGDLRELTRLLGETQSVLQDANYCTGKEKQIMQLMVDLGPLLGTDASGRLLHPSEGKAMRQGLVEALQSWEDRAVEPKQSGPREAELGL